MFSYDGEVLAAASGPVASVADVVRAMEAIDGVCMDTDGLKWFNWLYLAVTRAVEARVAAGGFQDPAWLAALDVQFAGLYFGVLRAALSGTGSVPDCWQVLFDRRGDFAVARIQFALAGIQCAHQPRSGGGDCRDGVRAGPRERALRGLYERERDVRHAGGEREDDAARAAPGDALPPVSHLEDTIAAFSVSAAREAAWNNAEVLWGLRGVPGLAARTLGTIDGMTAVIGKALLVPVV